jgi:hypothetical protein
MPLLTKKNGNKKLHKKVPNTPTTLIEHCAGTCRHLCCYCICAGTPCCYSVVLVLVRGGADQLSSLRQNAGDTL